MRCKFLRPPPHLLRDPIRANYVRFNHKDNGGGALCACPGYKTNQARTHQYAAHWLNSTISLVAELVAEKFAKKLLGESEIEAVLQRLDRLTLDEARMTGAQTLQIIHGLVNNMKVVMDGMQTTVTCRQLLIRLWLGRRQGFNERHPTGSKYAQRIVDITDLLIGNASCDARDDNQHKQDETLVIPYLRTVVGTETA